jgi:stage III sporulation protein AB
MKWLGALLFISTTTYLGFDLSNRLVQRADQLRQLIHSLQILEAEMGFSQLPLQQLFHSISQKVNKPLKGFYQKLSLQLTGVVTDFTKVWEAELESLKNRSALKKQEIEIMKQFGQNLGQHTFSQQQKQITLTIYHLQRELEEALDQRTKYDKMLKTLGVLIGIFIVLLLY